MKELEIKLTTQVVPSTMRAGGNFMEGHSKDEVPRVEEVPQPKSEEGEPKPKEGKTEATNGEKKEEIKEREDGDSQEGKEKKQKKEKRSEPSQKQVRKWAKFYAKENGLIWEALDSDVRRALEEYAREHGRPGPGAMGGPPPAPRSVEQIYGELSPERLSPEEKARFLTDRRLRDSYFHRFFELVNATPHEEFNSVFSNDLYRYPAYKGFIDLIHSSSLGRFDQELRDAITANLPAGRTFDQNLELLRRDFDRYQKLRTMKETMHNIRIILFVPSVDQEGLDKSLNAFDSEYGDIAFKQPGVLQMKDIYLDYLEEQKSQNDGSLSPEAITGKVSKDPDDPKITAVERGDAEIETKRRFMEMVRKGLVVTRDNDGQVVQLAEADFDPWQLESTYLLATGLSLIDQRLISVAAGSKLPEASGQYISPYLQDVLKSFSLFRHLLVKFQIYRNQLAPLLYKPGEVLQSLGFLKLWNPKKFHEIWEKFNDNPLSIGQWVPPAIGGRAKEISFIMEQNPFRGGDIWTWISWRLSPSRKKEITGLEKEEYVESMLRDFANRGEGRMKARWAAHHPGDPPADAYDTFIKNFNSNPNNSIEDVPPDKIPEAEGEIKNRMEAQWLAANPNTSTPEKYLRFIREYEKWIGTGIRFEKLRGGLSRFNLKETLAEQERIFEKDKAEGKRRNETRYEAKERRKKAKGALDDLKSARELLKRMTEIQPQRLYNISPEIRKRINVALGLAENAEQIDPKTPGSPGYVISRIRYNLSMVELAWRKDRETILQSGRTFDHVDQPPQGPLIPDTAFSIDSQVGSYIDLVVTDPAERTLVRDFITAFANDWTNHEEDYVSEFVTRRDYTHGWVLWAEDAPVDEFRFSILGTTAGFARKGRDNDNLKKAGDKLIDFLGSLKRVNEPEELIEPMGKIWTDISMYDADKADAFITDLAEGIDKTFAGDWRINIPVFGEVGKRFFKWSYARLVFDRSSPLWTATKIRHFHALLRKDQQISPGQQKDLNKNTPASKAEVAWDVGTTMTELIALAIIWYMVTNILSEKKH